MLDRISAIRSLGVKAALGAVLASTVLLAACGTPTTGGGTPGATANASLTSCSVSSTDLAPTSTTLGTAPAVSGVSGKIAIDGSTALAPLYQSAAKSFQTANSGVQISITPNGSGTGLKDAHAGAVNIGLSDVFASEKEPTPGAYSNLVDHQIAAVVFTLVTNNDLKGKVSNLTSDEILKIYTGVYTNWSQIGGPNENITVINRPSSSGTRATFKKYVLNGTTENGGQTLTQDTTGAVVQAVSGTPGAIGYVSLSFVAQDASTVSPVCIDGYKATATDLDAGNYKFWGIEHAYTKGPATGAAKTLIQYTLSDAIQKNDLLALDYLPLSTVSASAIASHTPTGAPAPETLAPLS
jgi:phosphate transport system substrate-binding protein